MYFLNLIYSVDMHRHKVKPIKQWDKMQRGFRKLFQMFWVRQACFYCWLFFCFGAYSFIFTYFIHQPPSLTWGVLMAWIRSPISWLTAHSCVVTAPLELLTLNILLKTSLKEISPYGPEYAPRLPYDSTVHTNNQGKKSKPLIIQHAHESWCFLVFS